MRLLILLGCLAFLVQSNAISATGGKGTANRGSPQAQKSTGTGGMFSQTGHGGGMAHRVDARNAPPLTEHRKVNEQDCSKPIDLTAGNLKCK